PQFLLAYARCSTMLRNTQLRLAPCCHDINAFRRRQRGAPLNWVCHPPFAGVAPCAWLARSVRLVATRFTPERLDHRLACGRNAICDPSFVGWRRRTVMRWMPLLVDTSAVATFENGMTSTVRPRRTLR